MDSSKDFIYMGVYVMHAPHPKLVGDYEFEFEGKTVRLNHKYDCKVYINSKLKPVN